MNQPRMLQLLFTFIAIAAWPVFSPAQAGTQPSSTGTYSIRGFGATGDGKTLDTPAINSAIDAASAAGGGTVYFPAGTYLSYSVHLKSNVSLYLDHGAILMAAPGVRGDGGYDPPEPNSFSRYQDFGHSHFHNSLIWGEHLENISILGPGLICGGQPAGAGASVDNLSRGVQGDPPPGSGNKSISLRECRNVTLRDISMLHGGHFAILVTGIDNLTIDNLKIDTNRDGMDIDCCRNVRVSNCSVNSPTDDGICLKSSFPLGFAKACENVSITNCFVTGGYAEGSLLDGTFRRSQRGGTGRIKFGTESNGGFKNIAISNCIFDYCGGLALEIVDGGTIDGCVISNITMRDITNMPIFIRLGDRHRGPNDPPPGIIRHISIDNLVCTSNLSTLASIISGIPGHEIEDIKLSNIRLIESGGGTKEQADLVLPENEIAYPEPTMFTGRGRGGAPGVPTTPSFGFFLRHVNGIELSNIDISCAQEDQRPAFALFDVQHADFHEIKTPHTDGVPSFLLNGVTDFSVRQYRGVADTQKDKVEKDKI